MPIRVASNQPNLFWATLPPTSGQRRLALAVFAVLLVAFGVTAPFAATPLPHVDAFIPSLEATIFVTDLITAVLLFAQFSINHSRALLALANGYLFTALIVIPHALTFPGVFSPTGLLGAGLQSTALLYIFWHIGFPVALLVYVWLVDEERAKYTTSVSTRSAIGWSMAIAISLVCGLTWFATAGDEFQPRLFLDRTHLGQVVHYAIALNLLICAFALASLWARRRSMLDYWLMTIACALISELALVGLFSTVRFSLGFYAGRMFSLVTATLLLLVLLSETTKIYARLARSIVMLERQRDNKLMNMEAMVASISHEVNQPLTAIAMNSGAALRFLRHAPPNLEEVQSSLNAIASDSHRAGEVFDSIRALFKATDKGQGSIDLNEVALTALRIMRNELEEHSITVFAELKPGLPLVMGQRGQLQEVMLNLVHNAVDAMDSIKDGRRVLRVKTDHPGGDEITVAVEDSGPGIDSTKLDSIFDAFVTTKPQGMGLGLAICRMIIESHGGNLSAWSSEKKGGALFQFTLPIKPAAGSIPTPA